MTKIDPEIIRVGEMKQKRMGVNLHSRRSLPLKNTHQLYHNHLPVSKEGNVANTLDTQWS